MMNLVYKARGDVAGIFALVAIGDEWKKKLNQSATFPIEVVLTQRPKKT